MMPIRKSQNWLPGIFNDFFGNEWIEKASANAPAINIIEDDHNYKVEVAAPGLTKDDFSLKIGQDNQLIVSMEKKEEFKEEEKNGKYLRREFSYSHFQQSMLLPDNVDKDKIEAKVENGILSIQIPKKEQAQQPPKATNIEIK
ncbi:MAG: Hsp20/alpha crystallin family protein [Tannerellaceae bacterium]